MKRITIAVLSCVLSLGMGMMSGCESDSSGKKDGTPVVDPGGDEPGGENPGGQNPGGENPGGQNPGGENPGGENPGGENPGGENPGGQNPGGQNPGGGNENDADTVTTEKCDNRWPESCDGQTANFCNEDGFVTHRDCAKLAQSTGKPLTCRVHPDNYADCVESCDDSTDLSATCNGKYVETHLCETVQGGGKYLFSFTDEPCPVACDGGKCVNSVKPVAGTACDDTFVPVCFEEKAYTCVADKVVETACVADEVCAVPYERSTAECTTKCSYGEVGETSGSCSTVDGKPTATTKICRAGSTEKPNYYWFTTVETCKDSCKDGVCDAKLPELDKPCTSDDTDVCVNNSLFYCHSEKNVWSEMKCGTGDLQGNPVCRYLTPTWGDCVFECAEEGEVLNAGCMTRKKIRYAETTTCKRATDGRLYYFSETIECENDCKSGQCL